VRVVPLTRHDATRQAGALELRTAFPRRVYEDDALTLTAAGLTPNATLLARFVE
jgi:hypothetical protein